MEGTGEGGTLSTTLQAPPVDAALERGASLGRYLILERLGAGAAGTVYSAYDPRLDRRIALKLLRERDPRAQARFLREMRALARLQHRNVVTVHDADEIAGQSFLAMELCPGGTLAQWCSAARRSPGELLGVFLEAGDGLAAAHAAGFVHRDFKPMNVLLGSDGHPRVGDFGLVRMAAGSLSGDERAGTLDGTALAVTGSGTRLGTPAYMAHEQHRGEVATEASDQFAYCVSLYSALFGQRPFAGEDAAGLMAAIERGPLPPPIRSRTEQGVWRVLRRGLAAAPKARFASMDELLGELRRVARPRRRAPVAVAALGVALVVGGLAWPRSQAPMCSEASPRLIGAWDPMRRAAVATAFRASKRAHADASLGLAYRALDEYAAAWVTMRDDACRATHERHEQSPELLDLRVSCLEERREELRAFTEELGRADPALVDKAATSARSLSSLARCADARALVSVLPPPDDPALRALIERTRAGLARVNALWIAGKLPEAHREAAPLIVVARATGYAPLQAEALFRDEQIDVQPPDLKVAAAQLRDAIVLAERGHDQEMQLLAWSALPFVQAKAGDRDAAIETMRHGEALLDGLQRPLRLEAEVMVRLGSAASAAESLADAERWQLRALHAREQLYPPGDPALGAPHASLGNIYQRVGRTQDSLQHQRAALGIYERALGDAHPRTCGAAVGLAAALTELDRLDEAQTIARRATSACERAFGGSSSALSVALMSESNVLHRLGRLDDALALLLRAQAISDAVSGPDSPAASAILGNLAWLRLHRGEIGAALELIDRALAIADKGFGPGSPEVRQETETRVEILLQARRPQDAIAPAERYRQLVRQVPGGDVRGRMILGRALVAAGKRAEARTLLAPIFDPAHSLTGRPIDIAAARFELARGLDDSSERQTQERAARAALARLGRPGEDMLRDLDNQLPVGVTPHR